jgi:hypothetical protein
MSDFAAVPVLDPRTPDDEHADAVVTDPDHDAVTSHDPPGLGFPLQQLAYLAVARGRFPR